MAEIKFRGSTYRGTAEGDHGVFRGGNSNGYVYEGKIAGDHPCVGVFTSPNGSTYFVECDADGESHGRELVCDAYGNTEYRRYEHGSGKKHALLRANGTCKYDGEDCRADYAPFVALQAMVVPIKELATTHADKAKKAVANKKAAGVVAPAAPKPKPVPACAAPQQMASPTKHEAALAQLKDIFPSVPPSAIADALGKAGGDVQKAADLLFKATQAAAALVPPMAGLHVGAAPGPSTGGGPSNRRVDFSETDEALGPIQGVFDDALNPPMSYIDAVGKISLNLKAELYAVKQFLKSQACLKALAAAPRLKPDHAAVLWLYTCESQLYKKLNQLLRARNRTELKAGFFPYLRLLLEAFAGLKTPTPRMVNRGVKLNLVAANPDLYVKGGELVWWGFSSTTTDIAALQNPMFLGSTGDRTIFQILTRRGIDIEPFSAVEGEAELLLPAGIALKITGVLPKDASGLTIITCEDDTDAPALIS